MLRALLLATTNRAKAEHLRWVFDGLAEGYRQLWPADGPPPAEDGSTFRRNAEIKASFWSGRVGGLAAASDGGVAIPALGAGWNPLWTARAAGKAADEATRARHLLALASGLKGQQRLAVWREGLALGRDGRLLASWEAHGPRALLLEEFDSNTLRPGFWAASLCYVPELGVTLADLDAAQLERADSTWSRLRELVHAYVSSGQADTDDLG